MHHKLRPYQKQIKQEVYNAWQAGHHNVLLCLPTGMGKTKTFSSIAIDMAAEGLPIAILVHRKELVQQISLTLAEEGLKHNIIAPRNVILQIIAAQRKLIGKQLYDYSSNVTVVSVDTLNSRLDRHKAWLPKIKIWITDEAAHVLAKNKWGRALAGFTNARGLGVTATPKRLDKRGLGKHADGVFDIMVEGPNSRWGIDNGFLSRYKIAVPKGDYRDHLKDAAEGADFTREAMAIASAKSHIVGDAVMNYQKFAAGKQAIYFCTDTNAGRKMEAAFTEAGVSAKLLTAETDDRVRLESLIAFRDKKIQVLLNIDLFDEGLDVPGIEVVGMCRPTMSTGKYLQMIGRGLRPMPGKEFCIIIDHVGNVNTHGLPDTPRNWTLDRIVKRRDKTNFIRICSNVECNSPFDRALTECPYCHTPFQLAGRGGGGGRVPISQVDGDLELLDPDTLRELYAGAVLEDPASVQARVSRVVSAQAGVKAARDQMARAETQNHLKEVIALWAGKMKHSGYTDRQIHKRFYLEYEMTITYALSLKRAEMQTMMDRIKDDIGTR